MSDWLTFTPAGFFEAIAVSAFVLLLGVVIPVQLAAKLRRLRLARLRIVCRICGYRFLRKDPQAICPHCEARNK